MGNNAAYTNWEATVIATYNRGVLDKELLSDLMEVYRDSDIDSGGKHGTLSNDGLDCDEITLKVFGVEIPAHPPLPENANLWTPEQHRQNEDYWDKRDELFSSITDKFGWR